MRMTTKKVMTMRIVMMTTKNVILMMTMRMTAKEGDPKEDVVVDKAG